MFSAANAEESEEPLPHSRRGGAAAGGRVTTGAIAIER
jgi:hypothetical protein